MAVKVDIDGVGIVEVPDAFLDLTAEQQEDYVLKVKQQVEEQRQSPVDEEIESEAADLSLIDKLGGGTRAFAQGLSFGFGDEIEAGLKTGFGIFGDYDKSVKDIRTNLDEFRKDAGALAFGLEMGGAVIPSLAAGLFSGGTGTAAGLGTTGARVAAGVNRAKAAAAAKAGVGAQKAKQAEQITEIVSDPSLMKSVLKGAGVGAGYGGLYGAGTAEGGLGERAVGAGTGAIIGGALGGTIPVALQGGIQGLKRVSQSLGMGGQKAAEQFSDVKILQALERSGLSRQGAIEKLQKAEKLGQKDILIADLGEDLAQLGYASQAIAGGSRQEVADVLEGRAAAQAERISDSLIDQTKLKGPFSREYVDELAAIQESKAGPAYREAYSVGVPSKTSVTHKDLAGNNVTVKLSDFFTGPRKELLIAAAREGRKTLRARGEQVPDISKLLKDEDALKAFLDKPIPTQYLHTIKRGLDSIIEKGTDAFGKVNQYGAAVTDSKVILNKLIEKANPAYGKANKQFSDIARLRDAFTVGVGDKRISADQLRKIVQKFNPAEQEAFRVGIIARIKDQSLKANDSANFVTRVFGSEEKRRIIRYAFPKTKEGQKAYKQFEEIIELEKQKVKTKNKVLGGSPTKTRMEAVEDAAIDPTLGVIGRAMAGDPVGAARQSLAAIGARASGLSPEGAKQVARKLFLQTPEEQIAYLKTLGEAERKLVEKSLRGIGLQAELSAAAGLLPGVATQ